MELNRLTTAQIRSHVVFGTRDIPYIDGETCEAVPMGLHEIRGVYPVDVYNAVHHDDPTAWKVLMQNGYIRI
jgi:hypothetical protein